MDGRPLPSRRDHRHRGAAKPAHRGGFHPGVADDLLIELLFHFKYRIDAFGGNVEPARARWEYQRGVEPVEDGNVDLAAAPAVGVHDEGAGDLIALRQVAGEQVDPMAFGYRAAGAGLLEQFAPRQVGQHLFLGLKEHAAQLDAAGAGVRSHQYQRSRQTAPHPAADLVLRCIQWPNSPPKTGDSILNPRFRPPAAPR
jgi:hypothetical protein